MITDQTKFDPDASDSRIVAALAARAQLEAAFLAQDAEAVDRFMAPDLIVNAPHNAVIERAVVMAGFRAGMMHYQTGIESQIEFAGVRDGAVVVMGEETVRPMPGAPHAGKKVRRRVTDIWRERDGAWLLVLRQATNFEVS